MLSVTTSILFTIFIVITVLSFIWFIICVVKDLSINSTIISLIGLGIALIILIVMCFVLIIEGW